MVDNKTKLELPLLMAMPKMEMTTSALIPFLISARIMFSQLRSKLMMMTTGNQMRTSLFNSMMQIQMMSL